MSFSNVAIKAENISKCYEIYNSPRDRLKQFFLPKLRKILGFHGRQYYRDFWALKEVSFEIKKGETVGLIGRNGSGKSTLLQIICGTLNPTMGTVTANGRIAALLELGSGFNPEFTGRENVYMNGALLGLSKEEVDSRYDDIISFADIGDFIEQPIKMYSSGMVVRLAFAVAINVDPQILVVDEALSVGDELFQRKCFSKIEMLKQAGTTILFVSHSGTQIIELCDRAILFDSGELLNSGKPKTIVGKYQKLLYAPEEKREEILNDIKSDNFLNSVEEKERKDQRIKIGYQKEDTSIYFDPFLVPQSTISYESKGATIDSVRILNMDGIQVNCLKTNHTYKYSYNVKFSTSATGVRFGLLLKTISGIELGGGVSASSTIDTISYIEAGSCYKVEFLFKCVLNTGTYFLNAGVLGFTDDQEVYLHRLLDACMFRVLPNSESTSTGLVNFDCTPKLTLLAKGENFYGIR